MSGSDIIWRKIKKYHELELPDDPGHSHVVQGHHFENRSQWILLNPTLTKYGIFVYTGVFQPAADTARKYQFLHVDTNDLVMLSVGQINELQPRGRIRPVFGSPDGAKSLPGASFLATGPKRDAALRRMEYAEGFERRQDELGVWKLTDEQKQSVVDEVAARLNDPNPPKRSQWYTLIKMSRTGNQFDPLLRFVDNTDQKGNRSERYGTAVSKLIEDAAQTAVSNSGDWESTRGIMTRLVKPGGEYHHLRGLVVDEDGVCKIPDRKIQRVLGKMNAFVRDFLVFGPDYAERRHMRALRQIRPDTILEVVDIDHTTLDVVVFDDEHPIAFGRPDLLTFRERKSGIVIGYSMSFNAPSFATFLDGLKHAIFEKDPDLMNGVAYPWFGKPIALGADNAKHLAGLNIKAAAREFGFATVAYRPARGWEKGATEHLYGILGMKLIHRMPGSTEMGPDERKKYDEERQKAMPVLTLGEMKGFLDYYFAYIHHYKPTEGLNELATLKGIPAEIWEEGIADAPEPPLIDPDIFVRLAGEETTGVISSKGFRWDYLHYDCPEFSIFTTQPSHKGRQYEARRDPNDLGSIQVKNPYSAKEQWIRVPVVDAEADYATGLKLYVHKAVVKYMRAQAKEADRDLQLLEAKEELQASLVELHERRRKHKTATKLAQFYARNVNKFERSRRVSMGRVEYSGGRLDLASVPERAAPTKLSRRAVGVMPTRPDEDDHSFASNDVATATVVRRSARNESDLKPKGNPYADGSADDLDEYDL
ncbi:MULTISPECIES: hypothetical protein [unclassified Rhizobium]|uniref:hypothetical protein n=1 Tax=unclassified Rhizobium TaxID=2613769 RepID=UPI0025E1DB01|nr:hypothetical protein [Rhizobium sp. UBA1881]